MNKYCINSAQTFINRISLTSPQKIIDYCAIDFYLLTDQFHSIGKIKWDFRTQNIIILIQMNEQLNSILFESKVKLSDIEEKLKQASLLIFNKHNEIQFNKTVQSNNQQYFVSPFDPQHLLPSVEIFLKHLDYNAMSLFVEEKLKLDPEVFDLRHLPTN